MADENATLRLEVRDPDGSRTARRLRHEGRVPGVVYGGDADSVPFAVDARELRYALTHGGAVLEVSVDGAQATPVIVKDTQRHPVNGAVLHVDLLRVRMDRPIQSTVILELDGVEEAPGVKEGGILEQITRELNIEALPGDIPDAVHHDVSAMEMNDTLTLAAVTAPPEVTLLDELEETVIATLSPPRVEEEPEEIEEETELVGEEGEEGPGEAGAAGAGRPPRGGPAPADVHERGRSLGGPRPRRAAGTARPGPRGARRDRPAVRRGAHPSGRRPGRPQRPALAGPRAGRPGLRPGPGGGGAPRVHRPGDRLQLRPGPLPGAAGRGARPGGARPRRHRPGRARRGRPVA